MTELPPKPEYGEFQTAEWSEDYGYWVIRDLTPEELAIKFPPPEPGEPLPPHEITMRQLILGLATDEWITWEEAEGWADRSTLPAAVNTVIGQMPEEQRAAARIAAKTMSVAERDNPILIGAAQLANPEMTLEQIDALIADAFTRWAEL